MAELVDAHDSNSCKRNLVRVRFPLAAQTRKRKPQWFSFFCFALAFLLKKQKDGQIMIVFFKSFLLEIKWQMLQIFYYRKMKAFSVHWPKKNLLEISINHEAPL